MTKLMKHPVIGAIIVISLWLLAWIVYGGQWILEALDAIGLSGPVYSAIVTAGLTVILGAAVGAVVGRVGGEGDA